MGIDTKRTVIGGVTYDLTTFGTKQSQAVLLRLARILGPAAAEVLSKGLDGVSQALSLAMNAATDQDLDFITDALAKRTKVVMIATTDAGPREVPTDLSAMYDSHFAGRLDEWVVWLGWGIRENFASFFNGKTFGEIVARLQKADTSRSKSPPISTG